MDRAETPWWRVHQGYRARGETSTLSNRSSMSLLRVRQHVLIFDSSSNVRSVRDTNVVICVVFARIRASEVFVSARWFPVPLPRAPSDSRRRACQQYRLLRSYESGDPPCHPLQPLRLSEKDDRDETERFLVDSAKARYSDAKGVGLDNTDMERMLQKRLYCWALYMGW